MQVVLTLDSEILVYYWKKLASGSINDEVVINQAFWLRLESSLVLFIKIFNVNEKNAPKTRLFFKLMLFPSFPGWLF